MSATVTTELRKKSVKLSTEQFRKLKQYRNKFNTSRDCCESIGITRSVLDRVLLAGSGAPESISKILEKI